MSSLVIVNKILQIITLSNPIFFIIIKIHIFLFVICHQLTYQQEQNTIRGAVADDISLEPLLSSKSAKKVENIVLYPDKYSWCELKDIKQIINYPACKSKIVSNKVCVGQCFSYSIPRTIPEIPGDRILHYCDSCRPINYTWEKVSLDYKEADLPGYTGPRSMDIIIELIHECACQSCYESSPSRYGEEGEEDDEDQYDSAGLGTSRSVDEPMRSDYGIESRHPLPLTP